MRKIGPQKKSKPTSETIASISTDAGIAVLAAASATNDGHAIALAGLGAIGKRIGQLIVSSVAKRRERRGLAWIQAYIEGLPNSDPNIAEAELHARGDNPEVQEAVIEGARAVEDALDDIVVPALARLTRIYVSNGIRVDPFFRGMRRLLCDVDDAEFRSLRAILQSVSSTDVISATGGIELQYLALEKGASPLVTYLREYPPDVQKAKATKNERVPLGQFSCVLRLFHLMKVSGIGHEAPSGFWGSQSGAHVIILDVTTVERALGVLA